MGELTLAVCLLTAVAGRHGGRCVPVQSAVAVRSVWALRDRLRRHCIYPVVGLSRPHLVYPLVWLRYTAVPMSREQCVRW